MNKNILFSHITAGVLLVIMATLAIVTIDDDAVTTDEAPHITAGYSYLKFKDMRINPEHPPLVKDLAALPLIFQDINFPLDSKSWTTNVNDQWTLAPQFLYESGNNPDNIIWWGRLAPILITLVLGFFVYMWTRELFGSLAGLFALTLYVLSPSFLAHGRLVTTDVPAAAMFFIGIYAYLRFLKHQTKKNFAIAAFVLAVAQLTKFSLVLLWTFFMGITFLWIVFRDSPTKLLSPHLLKKLFRYAAIFIGIVVLTFILIYPLYQFHVWNLPVEKQIQDLDVILNEPRQTPIHDAFVWMSDKPVLRAYAHYFSGLTMVFFRVAGGNTTYFLGEVASTAWWYYFPVVFVLKVPAALLFFLVFSSWLAIKKFWRTARSEKIRAWWLTMKEEMVAPHFEEIAMVLFIAFYWFISMRGNLNIGIRHVLPTLPFLYILIAGQMHRWVHAPVFAVKQGPLAAIGTILVSFLKKWVKAIVIILLVLWYFVSLMGSFPHYLAHFNEFAGGPANGYKYVVDSNLDWGQDLKRLEKFVAQNRIERIKVDYFGGGSPRYYLGNKLEQLRGDDGPQTGWIAISATLLQNGRAKAVKGFNRPTTYYQWLNAYQPIAKIGYSIFVYHIPE